MKGCFILYVFHLLFHTFEPAGPIIVSMAQVSCNWPSCPTILRMIVGCWLALLIMAGSSPLQPADLSPASSPLELPGTPGTSPLELPGTPASALGTPGQSESASPCGVPQPSQAAIEVHEPLVAAGGAGVDLPSDPPARSLPDVASDRPALTHNSWCKHDEQALVSTPFSGDPLGEVAIRVAIDFLKPEGPVQADIIARLGGKLVRREEAHHHLSSILRWKLCG